MNTNQETLRAVFSGANPVAPIHPDEADRSSLDDVYRKLGEAEVVLTDLAILCGRHLPTSLARRAERSLSTLIELRDIVLPAPNPDGPF
jgi:hypothetical protein